MKLRDTLAIFFVAKNFMRLPLQYFTSYNFLHEKKIKCQMTIFPIMKELRHGFNTLKSAKVFSCVFVN